MSDSENTNVGVQSASSGSEPAVSVAIDSGPFVKDAYAKDLDEMENDIDIGELRQPIKRAVGGQVTCGRCAPLNLRRVRWWC